MLTFLPIIYKLHLSMHLPVFMLTGFHTYTYSNLKVVTIRILAFLF